ncbi:hypothetical protein BGW39_000094 [Mortierella sp. 14UC]|nr:hypothetical protein BGW39_000094 [Mortierella sp. 14UC]
MDAFLLRGNKLYYHTAGYNVKLSVYSLDNVASGTPVLLREYTSVPCFEIGVQTRMALLQNTFYMICAQKYSLPLAGPALGTIDGGVDAVIPEKFGINPATATTGSVYLRPTYGGGGNGGSGGGGSNSGSDNGGSTVVIVAVKFPVKIIIIIVVAAQFVGGAILALFYSCIGSCCNIIKNAITGETPEIGVANVKALGVPEAKRNKAVGPRTGGPTYPVFDRQQPSAQDNGLAYLFIDNQPAPPSSNPAPSYSTL